MNNNTLKLTEGKQQYLLKPLTENEFLASEIFANDSVVESNKRYVFKDIGKYHFLFVRVNNREYELGFRLSKIDRAVWRTRIGTYTHFGYQMMIGDTKFKEAEIYINQDDVLMMKLTTFGSVRTIPLNVIASDYAVTSGISGGFGGYNIKFSKYGDDQVLEFAGIAFKKRKMN